MKANYTARVLVGAVATTLAALVSAPINTVPASAARCPDVEVTFARPTSEAPGVVDANAHVPSMAARCPNTKLVLGGYSQGAVVIDLITTAQAPVAGLSRII